MDSIGIALVMLAAVLVSGIFSRLIPFPLPLPLLQIALGMLVAGVFEQGVQLSPDVFFLLFLPPLLFLDGWRMPKDALRRNWASISLLALGLVLLTVVCLGYIVHWMVPAMPLAVAFALAAVVSPTDAVAVGGIARRLGAPRRIMNILEGEALLNDASGLVAFRVAIAAVATGTFSLSEAAQSFLWVALGGLAAGALLAWSVLMLRDRFTRRFGEEPGAEVLLSLLIPFGAYFLAEWIQASSILAVVSAGLMVSHCELSGRLSAMTRIRRRTVWDMVQFTLNGIMFVLLGEQLPRIFHSAAHAAAQSGHQNAWWLVMYTVVICVALALLRFGWITACLLVSRHVIRRGPQPEAPANLRSLLVLSLGGVRGGVTLAGVMSIPLLLPSGEAFPARDLAVFLAACVIIMSLLTASIGLPLILRGQPANALPPYDDQRRIAQRVARDAVQARILADNTRDHPNPGPEQAEALAALTDRVLLAVDDALEIAGVSQEPDDARAQHQIEVALHRSALEAARDAIHQLARHRTISDALARDMVYRLDLDELRL